MFSAVLVANRLGNIQNMRDSSSANSAVAIRDHMVCLFFAFFRSGRGLIRWFVAVRWRRSIVRMNRNDAIDAIVSAVVWLKSVASQG